MRGNKYIQTYRNNPSYNSMVFFIFLSMVSKTDQMRKKLRACKEIHLNIVLVQTEYRETETSTSNFVWPFLSES